MKNNLFREIMTMLITLSVVPPLGRASGGSSHPPPEEPGLDRP